MRETVKKNKTAEQAIVSLMRLCARAERSTGDARRLMFQWGVPKEEHEKIIGKLVGDKFIDDHRYAQAYVREKTNISGWGIYKIRSSLATKGIARAIIDEAIAPLDKDAMEGKLETLLARKSKTVKGKDVFDKKGKLMRYGMSLGYDYDLITDTIDKIFSGDD